MNAELHDQIYNELNLRETEDLVEIWRTHDQEQWSDTAFDVIREILMQRLGEVPAQGETAEEKEEESAEDDGFEEWEEKLLDDENQPEFYDPLEVIMLKNNIGKVAKAVIVIYALQGITTFGWFSQIVGSYFGDRQTFLPLIYLISFVLVSLSAAIGIAIVYFPLRALMQILRILMEMEFRSRKGI